MEVKKDRVWNKRNDRSKEEAKKNDKQKLQLKE